MSLGSRYHPLEGSHLGTYTACHLNKLMAQMPWIYWKFSSPFWRVLVDCGVFSVFVGMSRNWSWRASTWSWAAVKCDEPIVVAKDAWAG